MGDKGKGRNLISLEDEQQEGLEALKKALLRKKRLGMGQGETIQDPKDEKPNQNGNGSGGAGTF